MAASLPLGRHLAILLALVPSSLSQVLAWHCLSASWSPLSHGVLSLPPRQAPVFPVDPISDNLPRSGSWVQILGVPFLYCSPCPTDASLKVTMGNSGVR